jgi:hypothetical protein
MIEDLKHSKLFQPRTHSFAVGTGREANICFEGDENLAEAKGEII